MINVATKRVALQVDDYLDLLNFAIKVEDHRWQKEIIRKLERLNDSNSSSKIYQTNYIHFDHL